MNYTVVWVPLAENDLTSTWLAAPDRNAVTAASHRLDQDLATDPYAIGLPQGVPTARTAVDLPLGIEYEVVEDDKTVRVLRVWSL